MTNNYKENQNKEKLSIDELNKRFMKDFYNSFRHSQNLPNLQKLIFLYIVRDYKDKIDFSDCDREKLFTSLFESVKKLTIPSEHDPLDQNKKIDAYTYAQESDFGFIEMMKNFQSTLEKVIWDIFPNYLKYKKIDDTFNVEETYDSDPKWVIEWIARFMLAVEENFQIKGRKFKNEKEKYTSIMLQQFAKKEALTKPDVFDKIYLEVKALILSGENAEVNRLFACFKILYENNHPDDNELLNFS